VSKFLFVLTRGTEDPSRACRCMQLASIAQQGGHETHVFLTDDAVYFGKSGMCDNVVAPTGDEMMSHMEQLVQAKVPFYV
jgi:predicted peroxiredoxin